MLYQGHMTAAWDQIQGEPEQAYERFLLWLHSDGKITEHRDRGLSTLWRWRARRQAYHYMLHQERERAAVSEAQAIGQAHAQALESARDWAMESLAASRAEGVILPVKEIREYLKLALELERLRLGEPGSIVRADLSGVPQEVLEDADRALREIEKRVLA